MVPKLPRLFHLTKVNQKKKEISTFRPVSILNTFSKIYEIVIKYHHILTRLAEEWRERLDNNYIAGAISMDLSKAFECISHDLIIPKLAAYGLDDTALKLIFS